MSYLKIVQVPMLNDNYGYILHDPETSDTAVVDPSEAAPILNILNKNHWQLRYILNTHHHWDHIGGNKELKTQTGAKIICSKEDKHRIEGASAGMSEGSEFHIGRAPVQVIEIPGHTYGHIAFYLPTEYAVFCGDTMFSLGCGKLFEGTPAQMWNSLRRLGDLPEATNVYCGHEYTQSNAKFALSVDSNNNSLQAYAHYIDDLRGEGRSTVPSTIGQELLCNPFLRAPLLKENIGLSLNASPEEAFAKLRVMKDGFA